MLIRAYAPIYYIDIAGDYDRFGEVEWKADKVAVNYDMPAVYYYVTYAFYKGEPAMQINYVAWFRRRSGPVAPWMERGLLDGITIRITLDKFASPVTADIMNNCGCYHFFVPNKDYIANTISKPGEIGPLVPTWLPEELPEKHIKPYVMSGWHQVYRIDSGDIQDKALTYKLIPYDILEALPYNGERTRSVFNSSGIMRYSWRVEPFIFFSMGIPSVGYMRQRSNHPTKLVGEEYFTDPDLFDKNFLYK